MGIFKSFQCIWKQFRHLLFGLEVILSSIITHPVLILDLPVCLDAEQHVMRLPVLGINIMRIVGNYHWYAKFL